MTAVRHKRLSFFSLLILLVSIFLAKVADAQQPQPLQITVVTDGGASVEIAGQQIEKNYSNNGMVVVESFLGIQYAQTNERFAPSMLVPLSGTNTESTVNATSYGSNCYQPTFGPPNPFAPPQSEDCLFLNIWRQAIPGSDTDGNEMVELRPVMVWIHGGGFITGSGSEPVYDGSNLAAALNGVDAPIVVTLNYRLGVFGLLVTDYNTGVGGMNALGDQITALEWVQKNIEAFGGDPQRVTIFGESIGGVSVCLLSCSPKAKGLFHRAIVQSGQCLTDRLAPITTEAGIERTRTLLLDTGLTSIQEIKDLTANELLTEASTNFNNVAIDTSIMPRMPIELYREGLVNPTDMIIGSNSVDDPLIIGLPPSLYVTQGNQFDSYIRDTFSRDGGPVVDRILDAYSPEKYFGNKVSAYAYFQGDFLLRCGGRDMATLAANAVSGNVYHYAFTQHTNNDIGNGIVKAAGITNTDGWASHTVEVPFVFGNLGFTYLGPAQFPPTESEIALSRDEVVPRWVGFVGTGIPGANWQPVDKASQLKSLVISASGTVFQELPEKQLQCSAIPRYSAEFPSDKPSSAPSGSPIPSDKPSSAPSGSPIPSDNPSSAPSGSPSALLWVILLLQIRFY